VTTTADLIAETRRHLRSMSRDQMNKLAATINTTDATLSFTYDLKGVTEGSYLAVGLEIVYVWSVDGPAKTAVVERAQLGSAAAAATTGTIVRVNPLFPDFSIFAALNEELRAYSSPGVGLYRVGIVDLTYDPARSGYDLTGATGLIDVIDVETVGYLPGDQARLRPWRLLRGQDTADFASGFALVLYSGGYPGKTMRVTYKATFAPLAGLGDDVATVAGLHVEAHDIPPLGAAARLVAPREARRSESDAQPESRAAVEVPPGTSRNAAAGFLGLRQTRLAEEAARLRAFYVRVMSGA